MTTPTEIYELNFAHCFWSSFERDDWKLIEFSKWSGTYEFTGEEDALKYARTIVIDRKTLLFFKGVSYATSNKINDYFSKLETSGGDS